MIAYRLRIRFGRHLPSSRRRIADFLDRSLPGRALARNLRAAGVDASPSEWMRRVIGWSFAGAAVGWLWIGIVGGVLGFAAGISAPAVLLRRSTRNRARRLDESIPGALDDIAAALRAGANLPAAIGECEATGPLGEAFIVAKSELRMGGSLEDALERFAAHAGTAQASLVATALSLGYRAGGDVPRVLGVVAAAGRDRARLEREIRAATAQARLSGWVVALMPVAFLFLLGATSKDQTQLLLRTPAGWGLLGAGAMLEAAGIMWMRKLAQI